MKTQCYLQKCQASKTPLFIPIQSYSLAPALFYCISTTMIHLRITSNQKSRRRRTSARSLPRKLHKTPGKILVGDDRNTTARPLPGPRQGPCRVHPRGHSQARTCQVSATAPMQLPAHQLGRHLRVGTRLLGQLSACLRGGMQIFMEALPLHHLSSLPAYMVLTGWLAQARVKAGRSGCEVKGTRQRRIKCVLSRNKLAIA